MLNSQTLALVFYQKNKFGAFCAFIELSFPSHFNFYFSSGSFFFFFYLEKHLVEYFCVRSKIEMFDKQIITFMICAHGDRSADLNLFFISLLKLKAHLQMRDLTEGPPPSEESVFPDELILEGTDDKLGKPMDELEEVERTTGRRPTRERSRVMATRACAFDGKYVFQIKDQK